MSDQEQNEQKQQKVTIDGQEYQWSELSEEARNQMINVRVTDQEISRREQQLAIARTARRAYAAALSEALPAKS